jgi:hypothetical protein
VVHRAGGRGNGTHGRVSRTTSADVNSVNPASLTWGREVVLCHALAVKLHMCHALDVHFNGVEIVRITSPGMPNGRSRLNGSQGPSGWQDRNDVVWWRRRLHTLSNTCARSKVG